MPGDYPSLQEAIDGSAESDLICAQAGEYFENLTLTRSQRIVGAFGVEQTAILGDGDSPVIAVTLPAGARVEIDGIALGSLEARDEPLVSVDGGSFALMRSEVKDISGSWRYAVEAQNAAVELQTVHFEGLNSSSSYRPVAVYVSAGTLDAQDVQISGSSAGGIALSSVSGTLSGLVLDGLGNQPFSASSSLLDISDVAVLHSDSGDSQSLFTLESAGGSSTLHNLTVEGNAGKGVFLSGVDVRNVRMLDNTLERRGDSDGYALSAADSTLSQVLVVDNVLGSGGIRLVGSDLSHAWIAGNQGSGNFKYGLRVFEASRASNIVVAGHTSGDYNRGGVHMGCESTLEYAVVLGNESEGDGGGVGHDCNEGGIGSLISHTVVAQNAPSGLRYDNWWGFPPSLSYVDVWDNVENLAAYEDWPSYSSTELTQSNPQFNAVSTGLLGSDSFRLSKSSALVDWSQVSEDPDGSKADVGAFSGPGADGWDLDGDGLPAWWKPGGEPGGDWDCDDFDASVGGDC